MSQIEQKSFLDLAEIILAEVKKPLSAREIVAIAMSRGWLKTSGQTPWQTMKSKLAMDVLNNGESSRFQRAFQGLFTLRDSESAEYIAARFKKNKMDEDIAVIRASDLHLLIPQPGYFHYGVNRGKLNSIAFSMSRGVAEEDFTVIQLVSVFLVHYRGKFLTHMRSARLPESRLHGEYSIMLGGHVAIEDFAQLTLDLFEEDSLSDCSYILRELSEELVIQSVPNVLPCGYIYDDVREVSKQHLGLVYLVDLQKEKYEIGERGFLMNSKFETPIQIEARLEQFENWSVTLLHNLDQMLKK
ncbi:HTH domain-containing protein [Massilia glaciei]|uniref:HTH HARE-type domain-containing protein n=1 Tax=Massilia glaciei TaxID=1524097 RepID=A0A2U2HMR2_9BURK|nr:HTH domain-containing protein [Massilia glaciei]PWF48811.1 hypothetical protein C7C56_010080 [Massilia glaciei]